MPKVLNTKQGKTFNIKDEKYCIHYDGAVYHLSHRVGKWYNRRWEIIYSSQNKTLFRRRITDILVKI